MTAIHYSRGDRRNEAGGAYPDNRTARDFDAFEAAVLGDRAPRKGTLYVAAPFKVNGNGRPHRGKEEAEPRAWLPFDLDGMRDGAAWHDLALWLQRFRGFAYTTARHTPDVPRVRIVLEASRPVARTEGQRVGMVLEGDMRGTLGPDLAKFDQSVYRGEQPCYVPLAGAETYRFEGAPVDVDELLARAPEISDGPGASDRAEAAADADPILRELVARGMVKRELEPGRYAVACPCSAEHTSESQETSTVYMLPHFGGFKHGNFKCMHSHCEGREQRAFIEALGLGPRDREAPADDTQEPGPPPVDLLRPMAAPQLHVGDVPEVLAILADVHARATGWDASIMLAAGIGAACAALSDDVRLCVAPSSGWFESARLWVAIVAGPGAGKSPGSKAMLAPIFAMHREGVAQWLAEHKDDDEPGTPPALYTSDATTEALAETLRANPRGLLYFVDELESWLASHDAYRTGAGKDRGEWLRLYDGGPHQVNRIKRGAFFVPNWGASLLSATTPAALRKLAPKLPDDGLLQRLLLVIARPSTLPEGGVMSVETARAAHEWDSTLRRLYAAPGGVVRLSREAREAFEHERVDLHRLTLAFEDSHPSLAAHVAKRAAMLARLALVFHALDADNVHADLPGTTMAQAARFLRRQERHAMAVYGSMLGADTGMALARDIARAILASRLEAFNRRELTQRCRPFRGADEPARHAALTLLGDCGWLSPDSRTLGHGATWRVDPRVHALYAEHGEAARQRRDLVRSRMAEADQ